MILPTSGRSKLTVKNGQKGSMVPQDILTFQPLKEALLVSLAPNFIIADVIPINFRHLELSYQVAGPGKHF